MPSAKKTWISIALAAVIIIVVLGLAVIGAGTYVVYSHVQAQFVAVDTAASEFARARARFAGQTPLIGFDQDDEPEVNRPPASAPRHGIHALHVLAYDARNHKLVNVEVPGWVVRMMSASGHIRIANLDLSGDAGRITLDDLERHGPGLVLDRHTSRGSQVLVWAE
ncbi:MAG: hypothetical protein ACM3SQ_11780 [Betaproteobacteria bacterium]